MSNKIQDQLQGWAAKYVPIFNDLSERTQTKYYTQSPLNEVKSDIDLMIVGINPKGHKKTGAKNCSTESFLKGNDKWQERFINKWKIVEGAHHFLGYDKNYHPKSIDDDKKTVWTNISPFQSNNGFNDLPKIVIKDSIECLMQLISILKPKRIVLLSSKAFDVFDKYANDEIKRNIEHVKVLDDWDLQIGRIQNISTVCVNHPSGNWPISNTFTSIFIFLLFLIDDINNGKPIKKLSEVRNKMIDQLFLCQSRMNIKK